MISGLEGRHIADAASLLRNRSISATELVRDAIARAENRRDLNAFTLLMRDAGARRGRRSRPRDWRRPVSRAAARHPDHREGSRGRPRHADDGGVEGPGGDRIGRRAGRQPPARSRRDRHRQDQPARIRVRDHQRRDRLWRRSQPGRFGRGPQAAPAAAPPPPSSRAWDSPRSAPTPAARFASPPPHAASSA